jgi:hypothetical protein
MKRRSFAFSVLLSPVALVLPHGQSQAAVVAFDTANNYSVYSNFNGVNDGTGFQPWVYNTTSTGGAFINAAGNSYDTAGLPGQTFDLYENGTGTLNSAISSITRPFTGTLSAGQAVSFVDTLHYASGPSGGQPTSLLGFNLLNSAGTPVFTFAVAGGGAGYMLTDATQTSTLTSVTYNYQQADTFNFQLNDSAGDYTLTVFPTANPSSVTTLTGHISTSVSAPAAISVFNNDGGYSSDVQSSNFSITNVPEPMSAGMAMIGLVALARGRRQVR